MERHRQVKMLSIIALVIAIVGMSLGFAAFSTTLSISSSASVNPSSEDFKVVFSSSSTGAATDVIVPSSTDETISATPAKVNGLSLSDVQVSFTKPGGAVSYSFYIYNAGIYDAYITDINFGEKTCAAENGTTESFMQKACEDIYISVTGFSNSNVVSETIVLNDYVIKPGNSKWIELWVNYPESANIADGPFYIDFGDVTFNVSTVDNEEISFSIYDEYEDKTYSFKAAAGMTWGYWIESSYNDFCGFNDNYVGCGFGGNLADETISNRVENGKEYVCEYDF